MENNSALEMKFDPNVINHLGIQMYSTLSPVIAELIANSYDAESEKVSIYLNDKDEKEIIIEDNGHGMNFNDINDKFLKIGRDRRIDEGSSKSLNGKRNVIGKKGIGKLSFFGIAKNIAIETYKNSLMTSFELNWDELKRQGNISGKYMPRVIEHNKPSDKKHGTIIKLTQINRKSKFDAQGLAYSLSKSFIIFDEDDFNTYIIYNGANIEDSPISNELRYRAIDKYLEWDFPLTENKVESDYEYKDKITGKIVATKEKTIPEKMKGIALFSRGKLVNDYSFYDVKATSHGYSYISGWLNIDFIEEFSDDVISTNRQSLNWELENTAKLKVYLQKVIRAIYNEQSKQKKSDKITALKTESGIDLDKWLSSLPGHEKTLAKKISDIILNAQGIEFTKSVELIKYARDSFQFEAFKELANEIDQTEFEQPEKIINLFKEWEIIESREMYKIAQVRLETINKFDQHIKNNSKEVPELHQFLKQFPWILDPRIMNFKDEVTYSKLLKDNFVDTTLDDKDRRIDFLCQKFADNFFIIELKRPQKTVGMKELDQALDYVSFIKGKLSNEYPNNISCYIIGNNLSPLDKVNTLADSLSKNHIVYFKSYEELLCNARNYHQEFIDKYESFEK